MVYAAILRRWCWVVFCKEGEKQAVYYEIITTIDGMKLRSSAPLSLIFLGFSRQSYPEQLTKVLP